MKKNVDSGITTVRLTPEAEALLQAELEDRKKEDPSATKTDVIVESLIEHLGRKSPERALQALISLASKDPALQRALQMINVNGAKSSRSVDEIVKMIVLLALDRNTRDPETQPHNEAPSPGPTSSSVSVKKSRRK